MALSNSLKIKCFIGTGGVGKTTLASVYALKMSKENPKKKIKLITIDPSNRLKTFFGLAGEESSKSIGNLQVELNDRAKSLNEFVEEALKGKNVNAKKIFENKLFASLMQGLAVSQEFSSLYEISKNYENEELDFVIVDTPPLQNTADFLKSAEGLKAFFSSSLAQFFLSTDDQGILYKLINAARRQTLKFLSGLTGAEFVNEISFFFKVVEDLRGEILRTLNMSIEVLDKKSEIILVGNANELSLCGLHLALENFKDESLKIQRCILNNYEPGQITEGASLKMKELKNTFKNLKFKEIEKFKERPSNFNDLEKVAKYVSF